MNASTEITKTVTRKTWEWYVIETNQRYANLRTITSPHLLVPRPRPGDTVRGSVTINARATRTDDKVEIEVSVQPSTETEQRSVPVKIESCLGRSVDMGEDTADEAFGHDLINALLDEGLNFFLGSAPEVEQVGRETPLNTLYLELKTSWVAAPCVMKIAEKEERARYRFRSFSGVGSVENRGEIIFSEVVA